jgi:hypothetical protein
MNGGIPKWEGIWEKLPELTQWANDMPLFTIGLLNKNKLD